MCDLCESFKNADEKKKNKNCLTLINCTKKEKELSRQEKEQDKQNQNGTHVAVYDLQAVMLIPKALTSSFYYAIKNVECYFWNETDGNRGATEIGSCVLDYIKMIVEKANNSDLDLIFFSDNCCG
ncbi:hypothetical protein NQ317_007163 [Molorchus minor]|uniref:Uncharacterized protein n=1 Tax=Molorchus minor TaxID=1323400 RepID=A0ABQ9IQR5_9CUCU|nr:hypothetical protein NQ317_007163 [Molorchus minor]